MPDHSGIWSIDEARDQHRFSQTLSDALADALPMAEPVSDLGCGMGDYASSLLDRGYVVLAYDGTPNLDKIGSVSPIHEIDLTERFSFEERTNILCLEVGEHLPPQYESSFLDSLIRNSLHRIILSWAVPGQGGNGHLNEQSNYHIIAEMEKRGATYNTDLTESIRHDMKDDELWWFKNTIMVFDTTPMPIVGCAIIAKNEEKTISRAINSVLPHVDLIVLNSVGSTDNTNLVAKSAIPPWIRFEVIEPDWLGAADALNRSAGKCQDLGADWILRMDADCILRGSLPDFREYSYDVGAINMKYYNINEDHPSGELFSCWRTWLYRPEDATYKGVRHEGLFQTKMLSGSDAGDYFHYDDSGARPRVAETYLSDANAMEEALKSETDEAMIQRYTFYIANSYRDAGEHDTALIWYRLRSQMGGFRDEEAISLLNCARATQSRQDFLEGVIRFNERPDVAFSALENAYNSNDLKWMAEVLSYTKNANLVSDVMFNDPDNVWKVHDWIALCLMKLGDIECITRWETLLKNEQIPPNDLLRIQDAYLKAVYFHHPTGV